MVCKTFIASALVNENTSQSCTCHIDLECCFYKTKFCLGVSSYIIYFLILISYHSMLDNL